MKTELRWLLSAILLACSVRVEAAPVPEAIPASIPLPGAGVFGSTLAMPTLVYLPAGTGPFPVLLFSHGRAGSQQERHQLQHPLGRSQLAYWLGKGFAIVAPIRPGYGNTGGGDPEYHSAHMQAPGLCSGHPDYRRTAEGGGAALQAAIRWIGQQPWGAGQPIVLEGQSVGGLLTVAVAATTPPGVIGYINFAGGAGGNPEKSPGQSCEPEQLTRLYAELGRHTTLPNLWIYAENDQYWGPDAPVAWHKAFAAGGSPTRFIHAPAVADGDGHGLSRHPAVNWATYLDAFLRDLPGIARRTLPVVSQP
jgi:dienelactone hydrolase